MQSDATVRRARNRDVEGIHRVAGRTWRATDGDVLGEETVETVPESGYAAGSIRDTVDARDTSLFVVRADDRVVGYASTEPIDGGTIGNLAVYVDPDHWGEGLGERLLDRAMAEMRDSGRDRVRDHVLADNDVGNAFSEKHFDRVGTRAVTVADATREASVYEAEL